MVFEDKIEKCEFDKSKDTLITASQFLDIIRHSEEYKNLEKLEKKLYTKNKVIDFFKNTFFDDYSERVKTSNNSTSRNCIIGYRLIKDNEIEIEED